MVVYTKSRKLPTARNANKSIADALAAGSSVHEFGWGDAEVATMIHELFHMAGLRPYIDIFSSATTLVEAKAKAVQSFRDNNDLLDSFAFARTNGSHWQLVHASENNNGNISVQVFNPPGDGACSYRAAAECMMRVSEKYHADLGIGKIVPANGSKQAVEKQIEKVFRVIHPTSVATVNATEPTSTSNEAKVSNNSLPSASEMEAYKIATAEAQRVTSTSAMLESLNPQQKRAAVIAAQQKELDHWANIKNESVELQTKHKKPMEKQEQIDADEIYARKLQAEFDTEQLESSPRCGR